MYKHILIPTDGSELSDKAIEAGVSFARHLGASVTAFTAMPEYRVPSEADLMHRRGLSPADYDREMKAEAEQILARVAERARAAGVACDTDYAQSDVPHEAIVRAAEKHGCDLIFMASHGRRGISALVHGSQAQGVLTHSTIPTLVYR